MANVRARIRLTDNGPRSFRGRGREIKRGDSVVSSNPAEIAYFKAQSGFSVEMLEGKMKDVRRALLKKEEDSKAPPPPEPATGVFVREELERLTRQGLVQLIEDEKLKVKYGPQTTKKELIAGILGTTNEEASEPNDTKKKPAPSSKAPPVVESDDDDEEEDEDEDDEEEDEDDEEDDDDND